MKRAITIFLLILAFVIDKNYCQDIPEINDSDIYVCINDCIIPYLSTNGDTNIQISSYVVATDASFYNTTISYLLMDLALDKKNIKYMEKQIRHMTNNLKWEQNKIVGAVLIDNLPDYEGHHFSKPIISIDKNLFIIIKYSAAKPAGWCGTVDNYYIPMLFRKDNNKWTLLKTFEDERKNNNR